MSAIAGALPKLLRSIKRPGDFSVGGLRPSFLPAIDVEGVGRIAFPVPPAQAEQLIAIAEAAPHGRGTETVVDRDVRRTWQVATGSLHIGGRHWDKSLAEIVAEAARGLGVIEPVAADFYKLLIYDAGSFFVDHRDTEKAPGMFATLVIVLPSAHSGGELIVRHLGREVTLDLRPDDPAELGFAAFYADCVHEVRPVVSGYRLTLVYNLRFLKKGGRLDAPDYREEQARVSQLLRDWADTPDEPDKLILPLEHAYTPAELSFEALKGADAGRASVLVRAADEADCDLHLALMTVEESGSAEQTGYYSRGRWRGGGSEEADDGEAFDVVEVDDQSMTLSGWRRPDGKTAGLGDLPFDENELCPPDAFEDMTPDEQHFHEATGNEGASFERTYRRASLVPPHPSARGAEPRRPARHPAVSRRSRRALAGERCGNRLAAAARGRRAFAACAAHLAARGVAPRERRQCRPGARSAGSPRECGVDRYVSRRNVGPRSLRGVRK